ncbi:MAG: hypothetical protein L3J12_08240, partial [Spirochaetales bacterium]|nr:hypothetical protein [Spirochaetales bacterium]
MKSVFVEKKENYNTHSLELLHQLKDQLNLTGLEGVRILNRYDFEDPGTDLYDKICRTILSEPPVDNLYHDSLPIGENETAFAVKYLPGQFDQRADSASQCIQLITHGSREQIYTARIYGQEDFMMSTKKDGIWQKGTPLAGINTEQNEGAQSISADGKFLVFTACNRKDGYGSCDLYYSEVRDGRWTPPENIGSPINSKAWESQ